MINLATFKSEVQAKERATGLTLLGVPGNSWGEYGLDPWLPDLVTPEQRRAMEEVEAAHDPLGPPPRSAYRENRVKAYLPVGDQLDAIWHAMDNGILPKVEPMYSHNKAVKAQWPKP